MTETVVRVSTIEEWKSTLDVWFKQGYMWASGDKDYHDKYFDLGYHKLLLTRDNNIRKSSSTNKPFIKYADFMSQQKEDNNMETYYVTRDQYDLIEELKEKKFPLHAILTESNRYENIKVTLISQAEKALLRYLGGDTSIKFEIKDPLYRLWRIDDDGDMVYMRFHHGTPSWTTINKNAFTAPLEEIKKWKTPAWNVEEAK